MKLKILIYDIGCEGSGIIYPLKVAFENIGHEVEMFDWRQFRYSYKNLSLSNRIKDRLLFDIVAYKINMRIKEIIIRNSFDVFLVVRGDYVYPETILFAKTKIAKVFNWNSDDIFNKLNTSKHILNSFDKFDVHFSPRPHLKDEYMAKGAKSFKELQWYYRPGLLYPETYIGKSQNPNSISFVGAWSERRESFFDCLNDKELKICGWGWDKRKKVDAFKKWSFSGEISMTAMMELFYNTKVNVNILTKENRDSTNLRNFEIPAAGAFQLSERSEAILELFEEDKEIVCFESAEELVSKCKFYLANDTARNRIAMAGYKRLIQGNNSLMDRAREIINAVKD